MREEQLLTCRERGSGSSPGGLEDREAIERQLAQMDAFPLRDRVELCGSDNASMPSAEDELPFGKCALREDALAFRARVANLHIAEHRVTVGG